MDLLDLLAQDNFIIINRTLANEIGLENAIVLGALCSYQRAFKGEEFYREQDKLIQDTCLTEYLVRKAIKDLKELNLISIEKKGLPAKYYYKINTTSLIKILTTSGAKFDTTSDTKNDTTKNNNNKDNNSNNNIKENTKESEKESKILELFNEFWDIYPRKVDKKGSYKAFKNIDNIIEIAPEIISAVKKHKQTKQWQNSQYIPHPTTYLHQERWETVEEDRDIDKWFNDYWKDAKRETEREQIWKKEN